MSKKKMQTFFLKVSEKKPALLSQLKSLKNSITKINYKSVINLKNKDKLVANTLINYNKKKSNF